MKKEDELTTIDIRLHVIEMLKNFTGLLSL